MYSDLTRRRSKKLRLSKIEKYIKENCLPDDATDMQIASNIEAIATDLTKNYFVKNPKSYDNIDSLKEDYEIITKTDEWKEINDDGEIDNYNGEDNLEEIHVDIECVKSKWMNSRITFLLLLIPLRHLLLVLVVVLLIHRFLCLIMKTKQNGPFLYSKYRKY